MRGRAWIDAPLGSGLLEGHELAGDEQDALTAETLEDIAPVAIPELCVDAVEELDVRRDRGVGLEVVKDDRRVGKQVTEAHNRIWREVAQDQLELRMALVDAELQHRRAHAV